MSGYRGYSMSNNAFEAYLNDEMPLSRWLKTNLIEAIEDVLEDKANIVKFKKLTVKQLKKHFLTRTRGIIHLKCIMRLTSIALMKIMLIAF